MFICQRKLVRPCLWVSPTLTSPQPSRCSRLVSGVSLPTPPPTPFSSLQSRVSSTSRLRRGPYFLQTTRRSTETTWTASGWSSLNRAAAFTCSSPILTWNHNLTGLWLKMKVLSGLLVCFFQCKVSIWLTNMLDHKSWQPQHAYVTETLGKRTPNVWFLLLRYIFWL